MDAKMLQAMKDEELAEQEARLETDWDDAKRKAREAKETARAAHELARAQDRELALVRGERRRRARAGEGN